MPVSDITPYFSVAASGGNTYPFGFKIFEASELLVKVAGVEKILGLDFAVTITAEPGEGGSIVFQPGYIPAIGSGDVEGERVVVGERTTDYQEAGGFRQSVVDKDFDRLMMLLQQATWAAGRAIKMPAEESGAFVLPAGDRAGMVLGFDSVGGPVAVPWTSDESVGAMHLLGDEVAYGVKSFEAITVRGPADLAAAIALEGPTKKTIIYSQDIDLATNLVIPATVELLPLNGAIINHGAYTISYSGSTARWPLAQVFNGTGAVSGLAVSNCLWFGAKSDGVTNDMAAFKAAVAATATGGTLIIPRQSSHFSIDTSGGLTAAIDINKRMDVVLEGDVKATYGTMQANPPYIFKVSGAGVTFSGSGKLIGDGTIDSTNAGSQLTFAGLVYVTGKNFRISGVAFEKFPKVGLALIGAESASVTGCTFSGGSTDTADGLYTAIYSYQGQSHNIKGNIFKPNTDGSSQTQCLFAENTPHMRILGNYCYDAIRNFVYAYTDESIMGNNTVIYTVATQGNAFRLDGSKNLVIGNTSNGAAAGATIYDGHSNSIVNNHFLNNTEAGVNISVLNDASIAHHDNKITGNTITGSGAGVTFAVRIGGSTSASKGNTISDNIIEGFPTVSAGYGAISVGFSTGVYSGTLVANNNMRNVGIGTYFSNVTDSLVSANIIDTSTYPMREDVTNSTRNRYVNNVSTNATNIGILGLDAASTGNGNQYNGTMLTGQAAMPVAASLVVDHNGAAANAMIMVFPQNAAAAAHTGTKGVPRVAVGNGDFTILSADGSAFAGTEIFYYSIIQ